jgi:hypothetical protein
LEWIAEHSDGWITYPRPLGLQAQLAARWRDAVEAVAPGVFKPFAQSFYADLSDDPDQPPQPIHLGIRGGRHALFRLLDELRSAGVHHVILNLKYGARDAAEVLDEIGQEVLPQLNASQQTAPERTRAQSIR